MDSKVRKMTETYTSATEALTKLADAMQIKASSDLQEIKSMILLQATAVENVWMQSLMSFLPPF